MRMSNQTDRVIFPNSIFRQKHNTSCWYQFLDFTYDSNRELQSRALICICLKSTKSTDVTMRVFFVVKMTENSSIIKSFKLSTVLDSSMHNMRACVWARTQIIDARTLANSSLKQYWVCRNIQIELSSQIQFFDENTIHRVDISFWISHMIQIESYKVVPWFAYVWNQQNLLMSQCVFSLSWKWQITHS
jgi:hypothetical protein